ncbi:MAG: nucleotidyltransferase domain-containing protein [Mucilaginibacter polytrichastri]|nr:nucleotidyltransferase domain-containing protein [Mucilaginibacter polytrichastri]
MHSIRSYPATKNEILTELLKNRTALRKYGVISIGIFGSFAADLQTENSDIDILVALKKDKKTMRNFLDLNYFLEELLKHKVDLVTHESLSRHIRPHVEQTVEYAAIND